ncbi:MAG: hypothetical protein GQ564_19005 [Bacteroidales bacterium]|nr:hypothetical protein [Bacteroidales bacterium]
MKKIKILVLLFMILGLSCSEDEPITEGVFISLDVKISLTDQQGLDLLDPNNQNAINTDNIKIFHMIDGELKKFSKYLMDDSKCYRIYNPTELGFNENYVFNFAYTSPSYYTHEKEEPITYIQWNETDMDTVRCQYQYTSNSSICTKVWFNEIVVWDRDDSEANSSRWFQIVKTLQ